MSVRRTGNDPTTGKPGPVDAVRNQDGSISLVRRPPPKSSLSPEKFLAELLTDRLRAAGLLPIVQRHAAAHSVRLADVLGRSREANVAAARHGAVREIRATTRLSLPQIGRLFDRHHTSVLYAARGIAKAKPTTLETVFAAMRVI